MRARQRNVLIKAQYIGLTTDAGKWNGQIRLMEKNLDLPLRTRKPQVWAVWNDLFHEDVPFEFIHEAWDIMKACPRHIFLVLTKRPEKMKQALDRIYSLERLGWAKGFWNHVWLGVTAENQEQADKRIPVLLQISAAVRFVSVEPMLSSVYIKRLGVIECTNCRDGERWTNNIKPSACYKCGQLQGINSKVDWVICGGESGPEARPVHPDWVRGLRDQCVAAGVPYFFKQWGEWVPQKEWLKQETDPDAERKWVRIDGLRMFRVGKKSAGRLLDGQEYSQWPEVQA